MNIKLRDYQQEMVDKIDNEFKAGKHEVVVSASPSSGKTIIALAFMKLYPKASFLVLTHGTNVIKDMWAKEFRAQSMLASSNPGDELITYGLPQSKRHLLKLKKVDYMIIDEAHEFTFKSQTQKLINELNPKHIIHLTGTPSKFIEKGYVPLIIPAIDLIKKDIMSDVYVGMISTTAKIDQKDYNSEDELTTKAQKKLKDAAQSDIDSYLDVAKHYGIHNKKTMIACKSVEQANKIHKYLKKLNFNSLISTHDGDIDSDNVENFLGNAKVTHLVVVRRGVLGFNMPELTCVVDLTGSKNIDRIYQLYARVMRKYSFEPHKYFFKFASEELAEYMRFYMDASLNLMFMEFISQYNGKNLDKVPMVTGLVTTTRENHSKVENSVVKHKPITCKDPKAAIPMAQFLFDAYQDASSPNGIYAVTTFARIKIDSFGERIRIEWTEEMIQKEALKYKTRREFQIKSKGAYQTALKRNIIDKVCSHMELVNTYWTNDMIQEEALKYKTRMEFKTKSSGAYSSALRRQILDKVCNHMELVNTYWTEEMIQKEALKYKTRGEFQIKSNKAYSAAKSKNILDQVCNHMELVNNYWTNEMIEKEALKYKTRNEFRIKSNKAYQTALKRNIIDKVCSHMELVNTYWTEEMIQKEALKYKTRKEFTSNKAYSAAKSKNILDKVCSHMEIINIKWTEEMIQKEALKYKTRKEFQTKSRKAYQTALKRNIIDKVCNHMTKKPSKNDTMTVSSTDLSKPIREFIKK